MASYRDRKLIVAYSSAGKKETTFGTAMTQGSHDAAFPITNRSAPTRRQTQDEIRDCQGEDLVDSVLLTRLFNWSWDFDVTPQILTAMLAYAYGSASYTAGTPANEAQTLTISGAPTGGTFTITLNFEGVTDTTTAIAYNANAATVQAALESLKNIKAGNIAASGTLSGGMTLTFQNDLAKADIALMTTTDSLTGGTAPASAIVSTTNGSQHLHTITRSTSDQSPATSFIYGFAGSSQGPFQVKDFVVNSISFKAQVGQRLTASVDWRGSAKEVVASGFSLPACATQSVIRASDCRLLVNGNYYSDQLFSFDYSFGNNVFDGQDAFPFNDVDIFRLEHGDRTARLKATIFGEMGDVLSALGDSRSKVAVQLLMGPPGNRVTVDIPKGLVALQEAKISFAGQANRSAVNLDILPLYDSAVSNTPTRILAYNSQASAYLVAA